MLQRNTADKAAALALLKAQAKDMEETYGVHIFVVDPESDDKTGIMRQLHDLMMLVEKILGVHIFGLKVDVPNLKHFNTVYDGLDANFELRDAVPAFGNKNDPRIVSHLGNGCAHRAEFERHRGRR